MNSNEDYQNIKNQRVGIFLDEQLQTPAFLTIAARRKLIAVRKELRYVSDEFAPSAVRWVACIFEGLGSAI